ncbi:DUF1372 family protein, partial [Streptococcus suis]
VKRLVEREMVFMHYVDIACVTMFGKVTRKDIVDGRYYVEICAYGKFLFTKGQFETFNICDDIPDYLQGRCS